MFLIKGLYSANRKVKISANTNTNVTYVCHGVFSNFKNIKMSEGLLSLNNYLIIIDFILRQCLSMNTNDDITMCMQIFGMAWAWGPTQAGRRALETVWSCLIIICYAHETFIYHIKGSHKTKTAPNGEVPPP